jgi:hypothetical protein
MPERTIFVWTTVAVLIFLVSLPQLEAQSKAPWLGTWRLNPAKSTSSQDRYKRVTSKIEPWQDGLKITYDMVGTRGGVTHMEWTGKFDGKDYPVQGVDYVLTNAYTPIDDHSYQIVIKVDGATAATARVVISPDEKSLTTVTTEKNARGETITTTTVYDKVTGIQ